MIRRILTGIITVMFAVTLIGCGKQDSEIAGTENNNITATETDGIATAADATDSRDEKQEERITTEEAAKTTEEENSDKKDNAETTTEETVPGTGSYGGQENVPSPSGGTGMGDNGNEVPVITYDDNGNGTEEKTWHEPEYEDVWVVDTPAWTEEIPKYRWEERAYCNGCGAEITGREWEHAEAQVLAGVTGCGAWHTEWIQIPDGTETIEHPEVGHWEKRLVRAGYWE